MKNVSSKLFMCFRPELLDVDTDHCPHSPLEVDPKLGRSDTVFRVHKSSSSTPNLKVDHETSTSTSTNHPLISPSPKKNLSRVMKAVFFEIIPTRRIRYRKSLKRESDQSSRGSSSSSDGLTSPETTCSSSPSSLWPPSRSISAPELRILADQHQVSTPRRSVLQNDNNNNKNNYKKPRPEDNHNKFRIYILLVATLMATVFWGKLCAILFTSIWLYFLPGRGAAVVGSCSRRKVHGAMRLTYPGRMEESTGKYRRNRVVMEGMLERNHHHRRQR